VADEDDQEISSLPPKPLILQLSRTVTELPWKRCLTPTLQVA